MGVEGTPRDTVGRRSADTALTPGTIRRRNALGVDDWYDDVLAWFDGPTKEA
jgi:hypothetical protein